MARWDQFIEGASKGYGLGYDRAEQFQVGQDRRDLKKSTAEIGGILEGTNERPAAIPSESINIPEVDFQTTGYDKAGRRLHDIDVGDIASTPETPIQLTGKVTGPQTAEQMAQLRSALMRNYQLQGDTESMQNIDKKMLGFRQGKILENLDEAAKLIESNPQAAAEFLHNAYGYYPNNEQVMFTMKNGELHGYTFNEDTNKFSTAEKMDSKGLTAIAEQMRDPQAFKERVALENLAAASTKYTQEQDAAKLAIERAGLAIKERGVRVDESRAEYQNLLDYAKANGWDELDGVGGKRTKAAAAARTAVNGAVDYFNKQVEDGALPQHYLTAIGSDEGGSYGIGYTAVQGAVADIIHNNMSMDGPRARQLSDADAMNGAIAARMIEMFTGQELVGADASGDEDLAKVREDLMARNGGVSLGPQGTLDMVIDGQTYHLTPSKYPNIVRGLSGNTGGAPPSAPTQAVGGSDSQIDYGPKYEGLGEKAEAVYDSAVGGVADTMMGGRGDKLARSIQTVTQHAKNNFPVDQSTLRWLRLNSSPAELRQHGADPALIEALFPGQGSAVGAIPGVQ